ncbi:reverse transcriptase [Senna tora]|uniref:Reverse transcriptase n=1 Tax=Senna tora TaxID=362788 RepID=A0A834W7Z4_9FABA|nr:reverse transcriptase [Senna tora]
MASTKLTLWGMQVVFGFSGMQGKSSSLLREILSKKFMRFLRARTMVLSRPFRCEMIWLKEPVFLGIAEKAWQEAPNSSQGLNLIKGRALVWNRNSFGNVLQRKNRIFRQLEGINRAMNSGPNPHLILFEQSLAQEYQQILDLEEELWASKARLDWLQLGDSNTAFFHSSDINRRRKNKISAIKDSRGNWIYEFNNIREHIIDFFKDCFQCRPIDEFPSLVLGPIVDNSRHPQLESILSSEEIKKALSDLKPFKAAGLDFFQPGFFQSCLGFLEKDLVLEVQNVFSSTRVPQEWNKTMICLILKCLNPSEIKNFRPISMCSTLYKVVSKIIVNRLKPLIPDLLNFNQGAFVPGRKTIDNVVVAQEIVNSMKKKRKSKAGWMSIKLDLEKAYDKINWECFNPTRGIRQGDPLSPYLFILCMEVLSLLIYNQEIYQCCETCPRDLHPNLNFQVESKPGIYLGHPLGIGNRISDFKFIIDKMVGKMKVWNSKWLFKAGSAIGKGLQWGQRLLSLGLVSIIYAGHNTKSTISVFGLWELWLHRNRVIFEGKLSLLASSGRITFTKSTEYSHLAKDYHLNVDRETTWVKWVPPTVGWWKLNTDGSCLGNLGSMATTSIIRDNNGNWVSSMVGKFLGCMADHSRFVSWFSFVLAAVFVDSGFVPVFFCIGFKAV